ncbi:hypothetical protein COO91_10831 (plasmid) [Nostoc flagelliforme CCNUN1]|uniref:Uncharacterized protein n=1 Tax=Nostoc flagelliforme CCNUN1 TaxID=2038116 RepID=A0A2K8TAH9_9NOSO|nr:hypothetical protein COO91_10831 [Nostoc flagelliforme CCNUN1]
MFNHILAMPAAGYAYASNQKQPPKAWNNVFTLIHKIILLYSA